MLKRIALVIFISLTVLVTGCGDKQVVNQVVHNTTNDSKVNNVDNQTAQNTSASTNDYTKYTGTWVKESNLIDDFKYGIVLGITVDKAGNLQGQVSDSYENLTHISNVDIKGKIEDNKFTYKFDEDGWGHNGTIILDFNENKILLTINYGPNSSKDNFWGIGEGTFTLISSNTKVNRTLNNLKDGGLQVIENQCFSISLENYGKVRFISGLKREDANTIATFYLVDDKNNVLYKFPDFYGNKKGMFNDIRAISFVDVNNDGLKDIIVVANYTTDINFNTSTSNSIIISSIYFQKGKEFINDNNFDDKMNNSLKNKDVASIIKYAKENLVKQIG